MKKSALTLTLATILCAFSSLTLNAQSYDSIQDNEGNIYKTIKIGNQIWMAENLKTTHYNNGDLIPNVTSGTEWSSLTTGALCFYNNLSSNKEIYGGLYNWYVIDDERGICPSGWHIPTDAELDTLAMSLGGIDIAGGKLKESGISHWLSPNTGATNETGFSALPGGVRDIKGTFVNIGKSARWWSDESNDSINAYYWGVYYDTTDLFRYNGNWFYTNGLSVRCVSDTTEPTAIKLSVTQTNVLCNGTSTGFVSISVTGGTAPYTYKWSSSDTTQNIAGLTAGFYSVTVTDANASTGYKSVIITEPAAIQLSSTQKHVSEKGGNDGTINLTVSGGSVGYTYFWSNSAITQDINSLSAGAYIVTVIDGNGCAEIHSATITEPAFNYGSVKDNEGNIYKTVKIGNQVWMAENLKTTHYNNGNPIPYVSSGTEWSSLSKGAICYYNNSSSNFGTYGTLYNWYVINDERGICPIEYGWHIPSDAELDTLSNYLGGIDIAGGKLKHAGTTYWKSPNTGATNETGFTALPGGVRDIHGSFVNLGKDAHWWSNNSNDPINAYYWGLHYDTTDLFKYNGNWFYTNGLSVRCVKEINISHALTLSNTKADVLCKSDSTGSIDLTISGGITPYNYRWSNSDTTEDISGLAAGYYIVTVVDANANTGFTSVIITEPKAIYLSNIVTNVSLDSSSNGTVKLSVNGGTPPYSYLWNTTTTTQNIEGLAAGTYSVTVTDANNCKSKIVTTLTKELNCYSTIDFVSDSLSTLKHSFNPVTSDVATSYIWEFGDGASSKLKNPTHTYAVSGIYEVCLNTYDTSSGCIGKRICKNVKIGAGDICIADFSYSIKNEETYTVTFVNNSVNADSYYWAFNDGMSSNTDNPIHTFGNNGTYNVCLFVSNSSTGCQSQKCYDVNIKGETTVPQADFEYFIIDKSNNIVMLHNLSKNYDKAYWTFGDGNFYKGYETPHQYSKAGNYDVCLTVVRSSDNASAKTCKNIETGDVICDVNAMFNAFIDGDNKVSFSNISSGSYNSILWDFGDGSSSSQTNPSHTYSSAGFYLVSLAIRDSITECIDYYSDFLQVGQTECKASFEYTVNTDSLEVTFINNSSGNIANSYWHFGDGTGTVSKNPTKKFTYSGKYLVKLAVSTEDNTCADYVYEEILVGKIDCSSDFTVYVDSLNKKAYFNSIEIGDVTNYYWIFGDGKSTYVPNPIHTYPKAGYYTVLLNTYNNSNNCIDTREKLIMVGSEGDDCEADFYYEIVNDTMIKFWDDSKCKVKSYSWNFGDLSSLEKIQNPVHKFPKEGYYNVCLTSESTSGIKNTTCHVVEALIKEKPCKARFEWSPDSTQSSFVFVDKSFGNPDSWIWNFGDGDSNFVQDTTHEYKSKGAYPVSLTIKNSLTGCESTEYALINADNSSDKMKVQFVKKNSNNSALKKGGYPIDFIGISIGKPALYEWDFGDGNTETGTTTPQHIYDSAGDYVVCITASDPLLGTEDTYCDTIEVKGTVNTPSYTYNNVSLSVFPNPFRENTTLQYTLNKSQRVSISVFDIQGRKLSTLVNTQKTEGSHDLIWNTGNLAPGIYLIEIRTDGIRAEMKMVVKK